MEGLNKSKNENWIPSKLNNGWTYSTQILPNDYGKLLLDILADNYKHSNKIVWGERLQEGQIKINKKIIRTDRIIEKGDLVEWERPPWIEESVPMNIKIIYDDDDVILINKPSGLPVTPAGGFLKHTLTDLLLSQKYLNQKKLSPKPIHRLGRFTSGLIICAREKESRAKLSALLRTNKNKAIFCEKFYRALSIPNPSLNLGESIYVDIPISQSYHPYLGKIWNSQSSNKKDSHQTKNALSKVKLLERRNKADLLEISIVTGRPHQIRIHLAALGSPLIGDPLFLSRGEVSFSNTPGEGGYFLHAQKIKNILIRNKLHTFEAPIPKELQFNQEK